MAGAASEPAQAESREGSQAERNSEFHSGNSEFPSRPPTAEEMGFKGSPCAPRDVRRRARRNIQASAPPPAHRAASEAQVVLVRDLLKTVARFHRAGIIHRGLRPDAILVNCEKQAAARSPPALLALPARPGPQPRRGLHASPPLTLLCPTVAHTRSEGGRGGRRRETGRAAWG